MKRAVLVQSCVGGGPMERLANRLPAVGRRATVDSRYTADGWRQLMSSGQAGRIRARLGSFIGFPLATVLATGRQKRAIAVPTTNPFFLPGFMVATKLFHRAPVVPLVYDLWPDAVEASGALESNSVLSKLAVKFNRWWLHRSDGVVFIGPNMARRVAERYGQPPRSTVIETGADLAEFLDSVDDIGDTDLDRWLEKGPVASYVGNMGAMHDVDTLADAVQLLSKASMRHDLRILIAASGPGPEQLRLAWADYDETIVRFEDPLPDAQWRRVLIESDVAIVTLRDEAAHTSLPSKTFSAMAAGCAIVAVAPASSDLAQCVDACGAGVVVTPGESEELAEALMSYSSDEVLLQDHQSAARHAAKDRYDMPALADRWDDFLEALD